MIYFNPSCCWQKKRSSSSTTSSVTTANNKWPGFVLCRDRASGAEKESGNQDPGDNQEKNHNKSDRNTVSTLIFLLFFFYYFFYYFLSDSVNITIWIVVHTLIVQVVCYCQQHIFCWQFLIKSNVQIWWGKQKILPKSK